MKEIAIVLLLSLLVASAYAQEVGCGDKIEEAIANCKNCNVCPDGKVLGGGKICLYLFSGQGCLHCVEERFFLEELKQKYAELEVHEFEVYYNRENAKLFEEVCKKYGVQPAGVPATFVGDKVFFGFVRVCQANPDFALIVAGIVSFMLITILIVLLVSKKVRVKVKR